MNCHICNKETDWECEDCGEFVCEDCTMSYNQFTQIDYTLCKICGGVHEEEKAEELHNQFVQKEKDLKEKQVRSEKQRIYYHSEKAKEKRRLKKIEERKKEQEYRQERAIIVSEIFKDMFKFM